ncbi:acyltransferase family protein [Pseudomonas xanthosomatis]|uniref:acyltransferase family protein n=1 Tax=Pseudomonas xanthosomatis TaxID=2842356 RepID=UPI0035125829
MRKMRQLRNLNEGQGMLALVRITKDQSRQLDSIRALSALLVLVGHTHQTLLLPTLQMGSTLVGFFTQLSVMVFFVLSGFLIGKSVCNNVSKNGVFNIGQYARDRALRLYPPLIAAVLLMALLAPAAPLLFPSGTHSLLVIPGVNFVRTEFDVVAKELIGALAFLNGFKTNTPVANGPLWSLSIEAWYYVLAGALVLWPTRKWLSGGLLLLTLFITRKMPLFYFLAPVWFAGFGLALWHQRKPEMNNRLFSRLFVVLSVIVALTMVLVWNQSAPAKQGWADPFNYFRIASGLWFACFLAMIMGGAARFPAWFDRHAAYSYTLYVIHFPIMLFVLGVSQAYIFGSLLKSLIISGITIIVCIGGAMLIARFAENKALLLAATVGVKNMVTSK